MRWTPSLLVGTLCALAAPNTAHAQADVRVSLTTDGTHSTSISHVGAQLTPDITSVQITLGGSGTWDSFVGSGFALQPDVGANNDGVRSATLVVTPNMPLASGGNLLASGDTDGTVSGVTALVRWSDGTSRAAPLTLAGSTWSAVLQRPIPARPARLTWEAPTMNTDGTPLTNLAGFRLYWGTQPGDYPNSVSIGNPTARSHDVSGLQAGVTYHFAATALNSVGAESVFSAPATWLGVAAATPPAIPTGLQTRTDDIPVYTFFITRDSLDAVQIGTAPADVPCVGTMAILASGAAEVLYLVPRESVTLFPGVFPEAVFAACAP